MEPDFDKLILIQLVGPGLHMLDLTQLHSCALVLTIYFCCLWFEEAQNIRTDNLVVSSARNLKIVLTNLK